MRKPVKRSTRAEPPIKWGPPLRLPAEKWFRYRVLGRNPTRSRRECAFRTYDHLGNEVAAIRVRSIPGTSWHAVSLASDAAWEAIAEIRRLLALPDEEWAEEEALEHAKIAERKRKWRARKRPRAA